MSMSKSIVSALAICVALLGTTAGAGAAEAKKKSSTKKVLLGAGAGVAAGVAGTLLYNKFKSNSQETTGTVRPSRNVRADDDEDEPLPRRRGVDQTSTGSIYRASSSEACNVRSVDLFDRKGNFVKSERMRVCQ